MVPLTTGVPEDGLRPWGIHPPTSTSDQASIWADGCPARPAQASGAQMRPHLSVSHQLDPSDEEDASRPVASQEGMRGPSYPSYDDPGKLKQSSSICGTEYAAADHYSEA